VVQRVRQETVIFGPGDFLAAKTGKMRGQELGVEEAKAPSPQAMHRVDQRQF